jgi:hypothetical protein
MFASVEPPARETLTSTPPGTRYVAIRIAFGFGPSCQPSGAFQTTAGGSLSAGGRDPCSEAAPPIGGWFGGKAPPFMDPMSMGGWFGGKAPPFSESWPPPPVAGVRGAAVSGTVAAGDRPMP